LVILALNSTKNPRYSANVDYHGNDGWFRHSF
jgi:hypothetical protein